MHRRYIKWGAALTVAALLGTACGADEDDAASGEAETESTTTMASEGTSGAESGGDTPAVDTAGADLRAGLTSLLQEHVYLAGATIAQAVADGGNLEAPGTASAAQTLDANSVALSEAI